MKTTYEGMHATWHRKWDGSTWGYRTIRGGTIRWSGRIDELEARNAKLEAVARDDVRDMANFCIAQGASKPWQEIARRLLAALDALDD